MDTQHQLFSVTHVAAALGVSRQTVSTAANAIGVGTRLGESRHSPLLLSPADIERIKAKLAENLEKKHAGNFHSGNDLWRRRKKSSRKISKRPNR